MEHIHDLSAKLQKGDFAYLGGVFGDGLALFRFEQAVLGFTQFDTGQDRKSTRLNSSHAT